MKYDLLVSILLEQNKQEYTVSCDRQRMSTQAASKEEAIRNVCWRMAKGNRMRFQELKKNAKIVTEEKVKRDRCLKRADSVYGKKTSAYKSGAVVKCRQGKIWKKSK